MGPLDLQSDLHLLLDATRLGVINLSLDFIINIISQPIEHLKISSAFIIYAITEMHVFFFIYTAIMINYQLAISCLGNSVGRKREKNKLLFFRSALIVLMPYAIFIIVTIEKTVAFCINFSTFDMFFLSNLISTVK